ncbi:MAG: patatin-like phospholipase family protein [Candidatus Accumulibacter meliphilus]|jgi:NTE family protein|uniref:patatin-like phospholipase family protein n=1 Tax=Candidatus Accumulibacter meliphilus TaxID=2211374 RepID=UPI002FC39AE5
MLGYPTSSVFRLGQAILNKGEVKALKPALCAIQALPGFLRTAALAVALFTGCAAQPYNALLGKSDPDKAYTFANRLPHNSPKLFVVLTFSGGGTRAAAFTLGVLDKLAATEILVDGKARRLLDEVDVITAVSGGSFTAAYFGLFGERVVTEFPMRFLYRNVTGEIISWLLSPEQLVRIVAPHFSRTDAVAEYFDSTLFEQRTFAELSSSGNTPYIILNATDLNTGATFSFTQMQFDYLCCDLSNYSVARAVIASAAVPFLFSPVVLRNYPGPCAGRNPPWVTQALAERNPADRRFHAATALSSYSDANAVPNVWLIDGGIVDNLGIRGSIMSEVNHYGRVLEMAGAFSPDALSRVEHVLVIASNTQTVSGRDWLTSEDGPGLIDTTQALADATTNLLNAETSLLAQQSFDMWSAYVNAGRCPTCPKVTVDFAVLSFDRIADPAERREFQTTETSLHLAREKVDALRALPGRLLDESPEFGAFLRRVRPMPVADNRRFAN